MRKSRQSRKQKYWVPCMVMVILCLLGGQAFAQDKGMAVGLGLGAFHMPMEADLDKDGMPVDLFFDYDHSNLLKFRVGANLIAKGKADFNAFEKTWEPLLTTTSIYLAYRYSQDIPMVKNVNAFALGGLAVMMAGLEVDNGEGQTVEMDATSPGLFIGLGALYTFDFGLGLGAQYELLYGSGDFDGTTVSTGSHQFQLLCNYSF